LSVRFTSHESSSLHSIGFCIDTIKVFYTYSQSRLANQIKLNESYLPILFDPKPASQQERNRSIPLQNYSQNREKIYLHNWK